MTDSPTSNPPIDPAAVQAQLDRILSSAPFAASDRLQQFLRFIVDESLAGRGGSLKEYAIGVQVYGRGDTFDPKADSIVRSEARRMRGRLAAYYQGPGARDALVVELPVGRYVPTFHQRLVEPAGLATDPFRAQTDGVGEDSSPDEPSPPRRWWPARRGALLALAAGLVLLGVVLAIFVRNWSLEDPPRKVGLLIVPFERRADLPIPAGALETAMEFELGRSRVVQVIPKVRVEDGLRLMKAAVDAPLTLDLAQQVAARDSGIDVILSGWLAQASRGAVLHVSLREAASSRVLGVTQQAFASADDAVGAVGEVAAWLRRTVRDTPAAPRAELERVMTRSLAALEAYQRGMDLLDKGQWLAAEAMFADAVQQDPEFASARIYHAWTLQNIGRSRDQVLEAVRRAEAVANGVSERERLFIRASARDIAGRVEEARALYEALLQQYPDHRLALNNLTLHATGADVAKAAVYWARWADARPNDLDTNFEAAQWLAFRGDDERLARPYLERARALNTSDDREVVIDWLAASGPWRRGDVLPLRDAARRALAIRPSPRHAVQVGLLLQSAGHPSAAERAFEISDLPRVMHRWGLIAALSRGDHDRVVVHAAGLASTRANALSTILLAWAGAIDDADLMAGRRQESMTPGANARQVEALWAAADAERYLSRGETTQARPLLERAHTDLAGTSYPETFIVARSLARLRLGAGNAAGARDLLREAVGARTAAYESGMAFWLACARDLVVLERQAGDALAADRLDRQLATLLEAPRRRSTRAASVFSSLITP